MTVASEAIEAGAPIVRPNGHEKWPAPSDMLRYQYPSVNVWNDPALCKRREDCKPFTFEFYAARDTKDVKAQEKFTKGLATLEKKIIRERKARAKAAKS